MSPARDETLDEIRHAIHRLEAAGGPCSDDDIANELHMTPAQFHATMRQLFSDGRRVEPGDATHREGGFLI
jgi:hypothetical protein